MQRDKSPAAASTCEIVTILGRRIACPRFPKQPNRRNAADSASHLKFTALPRPQPAAIIATVILLCGAMSDLLSSNVAMRMSMGDEWLQGIWDSCKASNRCRPPPFSPRCRE
jgi:hypothetical protein